MGLAWRESQYHVAKVARPKRVSSSGAEWKDLCVWHQQVTTFVAVDTKMEGSVTESESIVMFLDSTSAARTEPIRAIAITFIARCCREV